MAWRAGCCGLLYRSRALRVSLSLFLSFSLTLLLQSELRVLRSRESQEKIINKIEKRIGTTNNSIKKKKNDKQIKRRYCLQQGWYEQRANPRKYTTATNLEGRRGTLFFSRATLWEIWEQGEIRGSLLSGRTGLKEGGRSGGFS